MKQKFDPKKPTCLMSPPPRFWRAAGNVYSDMANQFRGGTNPKEAGQEWLGAACDINARWNVVVMRINGNPLNAFDTCYPADIGMYLKRVGFLCANPASEHRSGEPARVAPFFKKKLRLNVVRVGSVWDGSSCARVSPRRKFAVVGYGERADRASCDEVGAHIKKSMAPNHVEVLPIKIKSEHIHLDTILACLSSQNPLVVVCRAAFAPADNEEWHPDRAYERLLELTEKEDSALECVSSKDGFGYATNLREDPDGHVYAPNGLSTFYSKVLRKHGYKVHPLDLPRLFGDGGGAAACLTLPLQDAVQDGWKPPEQYLFENVRRQIEEEIREYPEKQLPWN